MNEYAGLEDLKASLEISGESFLDDDLELALTAASRAIDNATGRRFWKDTADKTRYYTPPRGDVAWIDDLYALTSLATDDDRDGTFSQSWAENADFYLEPFNAAADGRPWTKISVAADRSALYLPCYRRSVRVTGKFGWPAVPAEIEQATKIVASKLAKRTREAPFGIVAFGVDGAVARIVSSDPQVQEMIGPFVRTNHVDAS